jgi:hypothetical protein
MLRAILFAVAIVSGFAGCGAKPESPGLPPSVEKRGSLLPVQSANKSEITPGKISKDVVGQVVEVPEQSGSGPSDQWTFEAGEYRHIQILERRGTTGGVDLLVFMLTRSIPKPGEADVQVSGNLRLHYEWEGKQWVLRSIENVSFRYSVGVAT